jgi:hypothetical protein
MALAIHGPNNRYTAVENVQYVPPDLIRSSMHYLFAVEH